MLHTRLARPLIRLPSHHRHATATTANALVGPDRAKAINYMHYWFSERNLRADAFLQKEILASDGWARGSVLCTFRTLQRITPMSPEILAEALSSSRVVEVRRLGDDWVFRAKALRQGVSELGEYFRETDRLKRIRAAPAYVLDPAVTVDVHACEESVNLACDRILGESGITMGLTVEYAVLAKGESRLPALLALAHAERVDLLWLDKLPGRGLDPAQLPASLRRLLASGDVVKLGCGISRDVKKLRDAWATGASQQSADVEIAGVLDIRQVLPDREEDRRMLKALYPDNGVTIVALAHLLLNRRMRRESLGVKGDEGLGVWRGAALAEEAERRAAEGARAALEVYWALGSPVPRHACRAKLGHEERAGSAN